MFVFVYIYSSYRLILSFPHLVVILTTLGIGTPKNIYCFNNIIMNDNSKEGHPGKNKFGCTLFIRRTTRPGYVGITTNLQIVLNTQKSPHLNQATSKMLAKFSYPKKPRNQKFQTQKNPSIILVT